LGAILKSALHLRTRPRGEGRGEQDFRNYRFEREDEEALTSWMRESLMIAAQECDHHVAVEERLIPYARPLLNLKGWPNPDAPRIKQLRKLCAEEAKKVN
jgi:hypothetical protein